MKWYLSYLLCLTLLLTGLSFAQESDPPVKTKAETDAETAEETLLPEAFFETLEYDFGTVKEGTVVKHDFLLENKGNANLIVKEVVPRCGCTVSKTDTDLILPGKKGTIQVRFDTNGFSGTKNKTVRVVTNDLNKPTSVLVLKGTIIPEVVVEPRWLAFKNVVQGESEKREKKFITVRVQEDSKVSLSGYRSHSSNLVVNELEKSKKLLKLEVSVAPEAPIGELRERVVIRFSGGKRSSINVPVFGSVINSIRLRPPVVSFGIIKERILKKEVRLENLGSESLELVKLKSNHPSLRASFKVIQPGKVYSIQVELDSQQLKQNLRSSIEIETSNQEQEPLSLAVKGVLPPDL